MLTLSLADNRTSPTGFTATVAGSLGAAVAVAYTPADRPWPGDDWIAGGTRVGDGILIVAAPPKFYFAYASVPGTASPPGRVAVTTGLDEDATLMGRSIVATLNLMALPNRSTYAGGLVFGDPGYGVIGAFDHLREDRMSLTYPCFEVTLDGQTEGQEKGSNACDDIVYPFRVMLYDTAVADTRHDHKPWIQYCRAKLSKAFRNQHLAGLRTSIVTKVEPLSIFQRQPTDGSKPANLYAGGFTIKVANREFRGLGA